MIPDLSVAVIARDEEDRLADCLESVRWAREIVVLDSGSSDRTVEVARRYTDLVFRQDWLGYVAQKNSALDRCTRPWILSLDADERVSEGLRREIFRTLERPDGELPDGFRVPRRTFYLGRWIRHGWSPDLQLRLLRRGRGRWVGPGVHEWIEVAGRAERLASPILHHTYRGLSEQLSKMDRYTTLDAEHRWRRGERAGLYGLFVLPPVKFLQVYLLKRAFLDGRAGLILSAMGAWYVFLKAAKLHEEGLRGREGEPRP